MVVSQKKRSGLLDEAEKRTKLNRKHLIVKLRPKSNPDKLSYCKKKRKQYYDNSVKPALVRMWQIFDCPCGQRLKPLLETETERMRKLGELLCPDKIAEKLKHQKEIERIRKKYQKKVHPLLYQKIPIKLSDEWDRHQLGNIQTDLIEHCGQSARGEYINTISNTDIATGWWEGEAIMGRGQIPTQQGLDEARKRFPFEWKEIHSDNGTEYINAHLFRYTEKERLGFSRSRPNRKNELRLYKNFFQLVIKLKEKVRIGGRVHRRYETAKTPYQRVIESKEVSKEKKGELKKIYQSLNPAQLKRTIDKKLDLLYKAYQKKNKSQRVKPYKKLKPIWVRNYIAQQEPISVR